MAYKPVIIFINIIIFLVFLSTFTYSAPHDTIENDILKTQDDTFYCPNSTSLVCCPLLAHRVASEYHSRCATIVLVNKSGYNLTLDTVNLEDGRWVTAGDYDGVIDINCEPHSILNNESEAISSVTSHFLGGVLGYVMFSMDDDISSKFIIHWDVPMVGSPGYLIYSLDESFTDKYRIVSQNSYGDTVYKVTIYEKIPWEWPSISPLYLVMFFIAGGFCCFCIPFMNFMSEELTNPHGRQGRQGRQYYDPFERQGQRQGQHYNTPFRQQGRQQYGHYNSTGQDKQLSYNFF